MIRKPTFLDYLISGLIFLGLTALGVYVCLKIVVYGYNFISPGIVWAEEDYFVNPKTEFPTEKAREMISIAKKTLDDCDAALGKFTPCPHWAKVLNKVRLKLGEDLEKCSCAVDDYEAGRLRNWKSLHALIANGFVEACFLEYLIHRFKEKDI